MTRVTFPRACASTKGSCARKHLVVDIGTDHGPFRADPFAQDPGPAHHAAPTIDCFASLRGFCEMGLMTCSHRLACVWSSDGELSICDEVLIDTAASNQAKCGNVKLPLPAIELFPDIRARNGNDHQ